MERACVHRDSPSCLDLAVSVLPARAAQPPLPRPGATRQDAHAWVGDRGLGVLRGACDERNRSWNASYARTGGADLRGRWGVDARRVQEGIQPTGRADLLSALQRVKGTRFGDALLLHSGGTER